MDGRVRPLAAVDGRRADRARGHAGLGRPRGPHGEGDPLGPGSPPARGQPATPSTYPALGVGHRVRSDLPPAPRPCARRWRPRRVAGDGCDDRRGGSRPGASAVGVHPHRGRPRPRGRVHTVGRLRDEGAPRRQRRDRGDPTRLPPLRLRARAGRVGRSSASAGARPQGPLRGGTVGRRPGAGHDDAPRRRMDHGEGRPPRARTRGARPARGRRRRSRARRIRRADRGSRPDPSLPGDDRTAHGPPLRRARRPLRRPARRRQGGRWDAERRLPGRDHAGLAAVPRGTRRRRRRVAGGDADQSPHGGARGRWQPRHGDALQGADRGGPRVPDPGPPRGRVGHPGGEVDPPHGVDRRGPQPDAPRRAGLDAQADGLPGQQRPGRRRADVSRREQGVEVLPVRPDRRVVGEHHPDVVRRHVLSGHQHRHGGDPRRRTSSSPASGRASTTSSPSPTVEPGPVPVSAPASGTSPPGGRGRPDRWFGWWEPPALRAAASAATIRP